MSAYIHDAVRTPRGKARPDGGLAALKPHELVTGLIDAMETRGHAPRAAEALILGCVGQVGAQGANVALVSKMHAGLDDAAFAFALNNYCVSGLTAVGQAAALVQTGAVGSALAGGVEMMSRVPFMGDKADYYEDASFPPRTRYLPVAVAADRLAEDIGVTRAEMDAAALTSQQRTAFAEGTPLTASRIPLNGLSHEEAARPKTSSESLASLPPAFAALAAPYAEALEGRVIDHRHTVSHAPPMSDGAGLAEAQNGFEYRVHHVGLTGGGELAEVLTQAFADGLEAQRCARAGSLLAERGGHVDGGFLCLPYRLHYFGRSAGSHDRDFVADIDAGIGQGAGGGAFDGA